MSEFVSTQKGTALKELQAPGKTIPEILLKRAATFGSSRAALRYKKDGVWNEYSWSDYLSYIEKVAGGLKVLGVEPGDKVCIIS
ncbi:MAG: hypothetical protein PVI66_09235, partial [Candidatus Aminicenantes bacterium]